MEMEGTDDGSVDQEDPHEWSSQKVTSFLRALGTVEYFQSATDQVLQLGVEVAALLSSSGKSLSAEQVRIWVDNFKTSLKKKKDGKDNQSAPNDKE